MTFDQSITWNTVITALVAIGGIFGFIYTMRAKLDSLGKRIEEKFDAIDKDVAAIRDLLTTQIKQDARLERLEEQTAEMRRDIRELRHGEGFINPLVPARRNFGPGETL